MEEFKMKKLFFSVLVLLALTACSTATPDTLLETAVNTFENEDFKVRMNIASIYDNGEVRIVNDNIGEVSVSDTIEVDAKVAIDGAYVDGTISVDGDNYTVDFGDINGTFGKEEYIEELGAALYGQFRELLTADVSEMESNTDNGVTLSYDLPNAETVFEVLSINQMHDLTNTDVSGNAVLNFKDSKTLDSGTLFVNFTGDLDGSEFTGSVKLEFSIIK